MSTKHKIISGGVGLFVVFLAVLAIRAQDAAQSVSEPSGDATKVALLDVNKLFKENAAFKEEMDKLKKDADDMDKKMKEVEAELKASATKLQKMTVGTPEYAELEESLAREKTSWTLKIQTQRREFLQREANIYRLTFQKFSAEVKKYALENQIDLVLRFMGDPVDVNNPESVLADLNKPVVHHNEKLDITPAILKILAEKK
jgi:Skp family chaperone for outer membrane proteins